MTDPKPWLAAEAGTSARRHAPATARNRDAIADVLNDWLPQSGLVLEVASGSGEHCAYFSERFPALRWQPTDPDPAALTSTAAWCEGLANVAAPLFLDAASHDWPVDQAEALLCINMVHISPWEATLGLMAGAARILPPGAPLILYGPYLRAGVETAASNLAFDASLKSRDPRWGLRDLDAVTNAAADHGLTAQALVEMPANNLMLLFRA